MAEPVVRVAEVTAERDVDDPPEIPWHLAGAPGTIAVQLRTTLPRVVAGAGLARSAGLLDAVRALPSRPVLVTSPVGGTFIVGGPGWLGLCAVAVPPAGQPMPLDWTLDGLRRWFAAALHPLGLQPVVGRVDGAWCPGFSDVAVGGRKLAGLGFRVSRDRVVMRGVLAISAVDDDDWELLTATHRLIGIDIRREAATSLSEATGRSWTVERAIQQFSPIVA